MIVNMNNKVPERSHVLYSERCFVFILVNDVYNCLVYKIYMESQ